MTGFRATGISRAHIKAAMEAFRQGAKVASRKYSMSTYVYDESDSSLWDLKALMVKASEISFNRKERAAPIVASDFVTSRYYRTFHELGFSILYFEVPKKRNLGLRGNEAAEFAEKHKLCRYFDDQGEAQYFAANAQNILENVPGRKTSSGQVFIRNINFVRQVLAAAKGVCQCCKRKAFKTPNGGWYLEAHHKRWLSEGGTDAVANMVALCPNCHRREHHGIERHYH